MSEGEKLNLDSGGCWKLQGSRPGKNVHLLEHEIRDLCHKSRGIFLSQPILLEICGDIHGQFYHCCGFPPESHYLFLGDYADRGKQSLETICLLLAYKIKYPENFFLLRGSHECPSINRIYGFYDECECAPPPAPGPPSLPHPAPLTPTTSAPASTASTMSVPGLLHPLHRPTSTLLYPLCPDHHIPYTPNRECISVHGRGQPLPHMPCADPGVRRRRALCEVAAWFTWLPVWPGSLPAGQGPAWAGAPLPWVSLSGWAPVPPIVPHGHDAP
ncbi:unnamed protein product [Caretta caretta]